MDEATRRISDAVYAACEKEGLVVEAYLVDTRTDSGISVRIGDVSRARIGNRDVPPEPPPDDQLPLMGVGT